MHIHQLDTLYKSYGSRNSPGVIWGHKGQKVIFTKNAISPTDYMLWSCDLCILISYIPSTKVMGLEIQSGSFGVTGVKRSFSPKNAISPSDYMVWSLDSCIFISSIPSTKLMGLEIQPEVIWGHRGQKVI